MTYDAKDIPVFQEEVCKSTCIRKGRCIEEGKDNHWFLTCPHYHSWKLGYSSFVWDQLRWMREHPEEAAQRHQEKVELAKRLNAKFKTQGTRKGKT